MAGGQEVLDLTEKKPRLLQIHHAYSHRFSDMKVAPVFKAERKEYLDSLPKGVKPECELTFKNRILIRMYEKESDAVKAQCKAYQRRLVAIGSSAKAAKQKYEESRLQLNLDQVDEDEDTSGQLSPETERLLLLAERQR